MLLQSGSIKDLSVIKMSEINIVLFEPETGKNIQSWLVHFQKFCTTKKYEVLKLNNICLEFLYK